MIKVWFHLHSEYSLDGCLKLNKIINLAEKNNIQAVILIDHNNLVPPEELEKIKKIKIISGEEIKTKEGEIIGLFLKEKIEPNLSPEETIRKIKEQGGLIIIPHPFDHFRREVIKKEALLRIVDQIDIVEIFNSRNILNSDNKKALEFAKKYNKVFIVGSDAHSIFEIDKTLIEMDDFSDPNNFLEKLKKAKFYTYRSSIFVHFLSTLNKILRKFRILK